MIVDTEGSSPLRAALSLGRWVFTIRNLAEHEPSREPKREREKPAFLHSFCLKPLVSLLRLPSMVGSDLEV